MGDKTPSLGALKVVEAAARHRSYSLAGAELHITHSAISQQVRKLEEDLGRRLFERRGQMMEPTPAAIELARAFLDASRIVDRTWGKLAPREPNSVLVVSMLASMLKLGLGPRLARLREAMGDTEIEIRTDRSLANFETDGVDVAIRSGAGHWPNVEARLLFREDATPICSPEFAERHQLREPQDLARVPLLIEEYPPWSSWLDAAGVVVNGPLNGLMFDDSAAALDAAVSGLGVALARRVTSADALAAGKVVAPFELSAPTGFDCYLVWKASTRKIAQIERFEDWLHSEFSTPPSDTPIISAA